MKKASSEAGIELSAPTRIAFGVADALTVFEIRVQLSKICFPCCSEVESSTIAVFENELQLITVRVDSRDLRLQPWSIHYVPVSVDFIADFEQSLSRYLNPNLP